MLKIELKNCLQMKLFLLAREFSVKHKWDELVETMKIFNNHLTNQYVKNYWKLIFQLVKCNLKDSNYLMPQFLDCMKSMNLINYNQIIYAYIFTVMSENRFDLANDILQMAQFSYNTDEAITPLIDSLKALIDYVKWKEIISTARVQNEPEYAQQLAERCIYQFRNLVEANHMADIQLIKLIEIYSYYSNFDELAELLRKYIMKNPEYLNAYKYYFKYLENHDPGNVLNALQKIVELSPSDSLVFEYCKLIVFVKNDFITALDCMFDMLDYSQWKHDQERWKYFMELLLRSEKTQELKECINDNWKIRESYWPSYHFGYFGTSEFDDVKAVVAGILMGPQKDFVKNALKVLKESKQKEIIIDALEIHHWLICN